MPADFNPYGVVGERGGEVTLLVKNIVSGQEGLVDYAFHFAV